MPVFWLPYASVSLKQRDRASGFLTPTFSGSGEKGMRLSNAYYQTLGRSADITFRNDIYTKRGLGFGADLRTRANSRSFLNLGFYTVRDRILGPKEDADHPDQGGSSFYVDGVHYFPNGFLAAADINITSNLAFRQIFSDSIQLAISPEERSQVFVNKNVGAYSFNFIARTQVTSIPTVRVRTRSLPGISFEKRPGLVSWLKDRLPVYFSFESSVEGVSRKETVEDLATFLAEGNQNPIITPSIVQRLDFRPTATLPLDWNGWGVTLTGRVRATYYSNSIDPLTRLVLPKDVVRGYGEFNLDVRPPALARNFRRGDGSFWFRHVVEPYLTYRKIGGISDGFHELIRFDETEAVADTNEFEYGVTNRFFLRRSAESSAAAEASPSARDASAPRTPGRAPRASATSARRAASARPKRGRRKRGRRKGRRRGGGRAPSVPQNTRVSGQLTALKASQSPLTRQPYEFLSVTVRQKYFFDPTFGGALIPGRRNQFYPINNFSGFTYGGVPRRFSPLNVEARLRTPTRADSELFADVRTDIDTLGEGGGVRDLAISFGVQAPRARAARHRSLPDLLLHARRHARALALPVQRPARQRARHVAGLAVEPFGLPRRPRPRAVRRRLLLLRLPEPAGQGQLLAHQLDRHGRQRLGLLHPRRPVLHLQRRPAQREPLRLQLPPQRHRRLRHRADRPALPLDLSPRSRFYFPCDKIPRPLRQSVNPPLKSII